MKNVPGGRSETPGPFTPMAISSLRYPTADGDIGERPSFASGFHAYRITSNATISTGLLSGISPEDCRNGHLLRHERAISKIIDSRANVIKFRRQQEEPVLIAGRNGEWNRLLKSLATPPNAAAAQDPDGRIHQVWPLLPTEAEAILRAGLPRLWVADGHHRNAAVGLLGQPLLAAVFPADSLALAAVHRGIPATCPFTPELLSILAEKFPLQLLDQTPKHPFPREGELRLLLSRNTYAIRSRSPGADSVAVAHLAEEILSLVTLGKHTGEQTPVAYFGGEAGAKALAEQVGDDSLAGGILLPAASLAEVEDAALNAQLFPPKTTWFVPKLIRGLVSLPF
ncbi:MAG: DUF1015 family protein [Opitutales bacterium]